MRHSDNRAALTEEVARFQAEIRRIAVAAAQAIVKDELDRRRARLAAGARRRTLLTAPEPARPREQPVRETAAAPEPPREPAAAGAAAAAAAAAAPANGRKRSPWTREAIIEELASWMASGTAIDAAFVARHGPPGLVAATRRIFGRFDAALNVAGLHFSKLYPDGPPNKLSTP
jgi:hypothetical protein